MDDWTIDFLFLPGSDFHEQWFIARGYNDNAEFLHQDGIVRSGTSHRKKYTGYFKTKEEAERALALYKMGIHQCSEGLYEGKWYAIVEGWYLHKDGIVRKNARSNAYFDTINEAERALNRYKAVAVINNDPLKYDDVSDIFLGQLAHNGPILDYWVDILKKEYERGYEEGKRQNFTVTDYQELSQSQQAGWRVEQMTDKKVAKSLRNSGVLGTWYIFSGRRYLHTDGAIRNSTSNNGIYSGYFKSEQAAREALLLFECRQLMERMDGEEKAGFIRHMIHTLLPLTKEN